MKQKISGFHQDHENHWVAELECGHAQHVRHDPPWTLREWVINETGRQAKLGTELNCVRCDDAARTIGNAVLGACRKQLKQAYEAAGISGLCEEGRWEAAIGALETLDPVTIGTAALEGEKKS